jgi:solute carrier family 25 carnitine/acylcarnitine transporter 20/29
LLHFVLAQVLGLYKGVMSPLIGIGLCNAVLFSANGVFREVLRNEGEHQLSLCRITLAGAMAGGVMALLNCPIELLKVRLQIQDATQSKTVRLARPCH